jgi:EpsD family peptidyl-prolyl cis-trans isomerase
MKKQRQLTNLALAILLGLTLAACGNKQETQSPAIAKVNGDSITAAELNQAMARLNITKPDQVAAAKPQVLKALVDQQLLVQKATEDRLDKDPAVAQLLEAARRQVLSQAFIERSAKGVTKPTDAEISAYYNQHPELFSQRRIYTLQELSISVSPDRVQEVKSHLDSSQSLGDFVAWMRSQNIPFRAGNGVKPAEQLPLEILPKLQSMQIGQSLAMPAPGGMTVLQILAEQNEPLSLDKSRTAIENFLMTAKQREAAETALKTLRANAKIEYLGEFSEGSKAPPQQSDSSNGGLPAIK